MFSSSSRLVSRYGTLADAVDHVVSVCGTALGPNGESFMRRAYAAGLDRYRRRLEAVGLCGSGRLLDAGCGLGQWSFAVAPTVTHVTGVDISEARVSVCRDMARALDVHNAAFQQAELERLPFGSSSFDAAVSYSVLYFTNYIRAIEELGRVLRPGARLYLSTNDIGRFLVDVVRNHNRASDFNPRRYGLAALWRTAIHRTTGAFPTAAPVAMSVRRTIAALSRAGFEILEVGPEGTLGAGDAPFQPGLFGGFTAVFDIIARRC